MWHFDEPVDGVLSVSIDRDGRPVNSLSIETMNELRGVAEFVSSRSDIRVVVFRSAKRGNFIAGADLYEIRENATYDATLRMSRNGHSAFQAIEELSATTIAVIEGVALGGGLEFALACDYRVAADDPRTFFGLPEVHLGLMPGFGGTVRTRELVGVERLMDMLLGGGNLSAADALECGLVDRVAASGDDLMSAVDDLVAGGTGSDRPAPLSSDEAHQLLDQLDQQYRTEHGDHYPAPLKMIEVVRKGLNATDDERYELEADGIATLAPNPVTEQLIRLFFLKEASKKPPAEFKEAAKAFEFKRVGVVADGPFGEEIAALFAKRGVHTQLAQLGATDVNVAAPSAELLDRGTDIADLDDARVVIEAVVDDLDAERGMFQQLGLVVHPDAVIASTSASFLLKEQAEGLPEPGRLIGLRLYSPVATVTLAEIVRTEATAASTLGAGYSIARRLGKNVVLVNDSPGFLVNRLLIPYLIECSELLIECGDATRVAKIATDFGMTQNPFSVTDDIGLSVIAAILKRLHTEADELVAPAAIWRSMLDSDSEDTLLLNADGELSDVARQQMEKLSAERSDDPSLNESEAVDRMILPMVNAGASCLAAGVVSSADEIDLALILAGGFPAFRGGPMQYAETRGLDSVVARMTELAATFPRLTPSNELVAFAERGTFAS